MTNNDINNLEVRDYIFKIGDRGKGIQARYDADIDALIFPRAAFDYVFELLEEELSKEKLGKWIIKEDNTSYVKTIPRRWAECSCCKWSMSPGYVDRYAFCPNCGAKMESDAE